MRIFNAMIPRRPPLTRDAMADHRMERQQLLLVGSLGGMFSSEDQK